MLIKEMDVKGPFHGGPMPNMVDIMLLPHAFRIGVILKHFRGFDVPQAERWKRYHYWLSATLEIDSVKQTLPDKNKLVSNYK